jgi:hypothetical protein
MGILVLYPDSENESQSNVDLDLGLEYVMQLVARNASLTQFQCDCSPRAQRR